MAPSGGGMAFYDANTAAAALTALGRALAAFSTQDDNPGLNSYADANFLRGLVSAHMHAIAQAVKTAYPAAKMEWLLPLDTNNPTVYWNAGYPYPQGGRLNSYRQRKRGRSVPQLHDCRQQRRHQVPRKGRRRNACHDGPRSVRCFRRPTARRPRWRRSRCGV